MSQDQSHEGRQFIDSSLPAEVRAADLVSRMTLDEKIDQMLYTAPAIKRLGVPEYNWWNECLHGVARAGLATVFPQAIGVAASFNTELVAQLAEAISDEARAKHHEAVRQNIRQIYTGLTYWTPNINIFRDPRWGRGQETYGEDPYLTTEMGLTFIKGIQGDDPTYLKLVATAKHYAVHSGPEADRHHFDARVDARDLYETYLPAFEACVKEGQAASVMGAYNRTNGEPCCASPTLLEDILRQKWGFTGYVVSDCWAIIDLYAHHKVVETPAQAAALAVNTGCDLNCGSTYPYLKEAVKQGLIDEATITRAVTRLFTARFQLGMFDPDEQVPYAKIPYSVNNSAEHQALALQAARESIVLLKNENDLLPLTKSLNSIAVIGPNIDEVAVLLGNYNGTAAQPVTVLAGIQEKLNERATVYAARGCHIAQGVPPLEAIPSTYLRPQASDTGQSGLQATYYDNANFAGEPVKNQVDPKVEFHWKFESPLGGPNFNHFSIRWQGYLVPPVSGTYQLGVNGFNYCHLFLNGETFIEYDDVHHAAVRTKEVELQAGQTYEVQLDFINRGLDPQAQLLWAIPGIDYESAALEAAQQADVTVMVLGLSPNLEGEEMPVRVEGFKGGDRTDIKLPNPQEALLKRVQALGKPLVLVLMNGSALAIPWAKENVPAIIEAWYPGQAGGTALADVLFGDYNPGGRLPVTFYSSLADLPPFEDYNMEGHTYRYFRGEPLFPFGYGLSYTTFQLDNLTIDRTQVVVSEDTILTEAVSVSISVKNSGSRRGDEVVQLYISHPQATVSRPTKELKGYKRVTLEAGQQKTVTFSLPIHLVGYYDEAMRLSVVPGPVKIMVGNSSANIQQTAEFTIMGQAVEIKDARVFLSKVQVNGNG